VVQEKEAGDGGEKKRRSVREKVKILYRRKNERKPRL